MVRRAGGHSWWSQSRGGWWMRRRPRTVEPVPHRRSHSGPKSREPQPTGAVSARALWRMPGTGDGARGGPTAFCNGWHQSPEVTVGWLDQRWPWSTMEWTRIHIRSLRWPNWPGSQRVEKERAWDEGRGRCPWLSELKYIGRQVWTGVNWCE